MSIFPQFTRPWPKPRIKLADWPFNRNSAWRWTCLGPPEILSFDQVVGYGATPQAAYLDFARRAERSQRLNWGRRHGWRYEMVGEAHHG